MSEMRELYHGDCRVLIGILCVRLCLEVFGSVRKGEEVSVQE